MAVTARRILAPVTSSGGGAGHKLHAGAAASSEGAAAHPGNARTVEAVPQIADPPSHAEVAPSSISRSHRCSGDSCKEEKEMVQYPWALETQERLNEVILKF